MPSTRSSSFWSDLPSSTVITPSLPTLSIASAMILPISESAFAEIEPTCAISLELEQGLETFFSSSTTPSTALSMPRFRSIGFMPEATNFMPSRTIAWARTVAFDHAHDVFLAHHEELIALDAHGLPGVLAEQDPVARLDVQGDQLALLVFLALADRYDLALVGFFGGGIRNDDASGGLLFLFN